MAMGGVGKHILPCIDRMVNMEACTEWERAYFMHEAKHACPF